MHERIVQWVLLHNPQYLRDRLTFNWDRVLGAGFTTPYGVIDFALQCRDSTIHVVELETGITSTAKLAYCIEQTERYLHLDELWARPVNATVLYAVDLTSPQFTRQLQEASHQKGFALRTYYQSEVATLYDETIRRLERTSGLDIGPPVALDVCYLRWMNRIIALFDSKTTLTKTSALEAFGESNQTGFNVRLRYCEDFDLIDISGSGKRATISLTQMGEKFREGLNPLLSPRRAEIPLSLQQKSIIIEALMNGRITKCKANIFHFLRYVHLTGGKLIPRERVRVPDEYVKVWNTYLGTSYIRSTLTKLLHFTCNQCEELDLIERIATQGSNLPTRSS